MRSPSSESRHFFSISKIKLLQKTSSFGKNLPNVFRKIQETWSVFLKRKVGWYRPWFLSLQINSGKQRFSIKTCCSLFNWRLRKITLTSSWIVLLFWLLCLIRWWSWLAIDPLLLFFSQFPRRSEQWKVKNVSLSKIFFGRSRISVGNKVSNTVRLCEHLKKFSSSHAFSWIFVLSIQKSQIH